jgi:hypothetical protein
MSETPTETTASDDPALHRRRTRNRILLVGLIVLAMMPLWAAVALYYGNPEAVTGAQTNRGALLDPPADFSELGLTDAGGALSAEGPRLWRIVHYLPVRCDEACLERIHLLRQTQVLLGRDSDRVVRLAAFTELPDAEARARLAEFFPDLEVVQAPPERMQMLLRERALRGGDALAEGAEIPAEALLVVDPLGNVILFHGLHQIGDALLFDLKRLLRLSNIG